MDDDFIDTLKYVFGEENIVIFDEVPKMRGTIARVWQDKSFGFIKGDNGTDYFFHRSDVTGFFDDIAEDFARNVSIEVTFDVAPSVKGPRAANVTRTDGGLPKED